MSEFVFTWDKEKAKLNYQKHGIKFSEAETVFNDDNLIYKMDIKHSVAEERFIAIGMSAKPRVLMVCHCIKYGIVLRIISARPANQTEILEYERS